MDPTIIELERIAAGLWVAPEQEPLGSWLLRSAAGFTGRANSVLPLGDPGVPLPDAVAAVSRWYRARGLPPMIAIPVPLDGDGGPLDEHLADRGWTVRSGAAYVMTAPLDVVAGDATAPTVCVDPEPDEAWCALYHYRGTALPPIARTLLMSAPWQAFASVRIGASTTAIGRVAVAGDWASITAVETDPAWRRRGLAATITSALCREARARGASRVLLPRRPTSHTVNATTVFVRQTDSTNGDKYGYSGQQTVGFAYRDNLGIRLRDAGVAWEGRGKCLGCDRS